VLKEKFGDGGQYFAAKNFMSFGTQSTDQQDRPSGLLNQAGEY
jgi:hypothetical protein